MNEKLRQETLGILLKNFGNSGTNKSIYECADEWCRKQVTTAGLVSYFKAYYGNERQEGSQADNQTSKETS